MPVSASSGKIRPFSLLEPDLGFGTTVTQSSAFAPEYQAARLYPPARDREFFFHTALQTDPWMVIDLGTARTIGRVTVWNRRSARPDFLARAVPLLVSCSIDGHTWTEAASWQEPFDGPGGMPLSIDWASGVRARYLRLAALKQTYLHLFYVQVAPFVPRLKWGDIVNLRKSSRGDAACDYLLGVNNGLFSNLSIALEELLTISRCGMKVGSIDFSISFRAFKDSPYEDVYPLFFASDADIGPEWFAGRGVEFHSGDVNKIYKSLPLAGLHKIAAAFFSPSRWVLDHVDRMLASAGIRPDRTIAILYRGTDKHMEVALAPIEQYIDVARKLRRDDPGLDVVVQTDQLQARDAVLRAFPGAARHFPELPVTDTDTAIHNLNIPALYALDRGEFAARLMAATILLSRCKYLVNHTGNVALWAMIYRGGAEGVFQFDSQAELIEP